MRDEDIIPEVFEEAKSLSQKKIKAFLEKESYVMHNEFQTYKDYGLVGVNSNFDM